MSSVATLSKQLVNYQQLEFHHNAQIADYLNQVQQWHHQRMLQIHHRLFTQPNNQAMANFLLSRLYNLQDFELLAQQLSKALKEKIKLDRWLPQTVLETAELGFELAFFTIKLDQQIAIYCLQHQLEINEENVLAAIHHHHQLKARKEQLQLLLKLGNAFHHYSRSFIIQTALKMAKNTVYRRGFDPLYHYLLDGFAAMRQLSSTKYFFEQFIQQEKSLLRLIAEGHPAPLQQLLAMNSSLDAALLSDNVLKS
jgi:hypothetical protein